MPSFCNQTNREVYVIHHIISQNTKCMFLLYKKLCETMRSTDHNHWSISFSILSCIWLQPFWPFQVKEYPILNPGSNLHETIFINQWIWQQPFWPFQVKGHPILNPGSNLHETIFINQWTWLQPFHPMVTHMKSIRNYWHLFLVFFFFCVVMSKSD